MKKRIIASILIVLLLMLGFMKIAISTDVTTPTDLEPDLRNYSVTLSNLPQYSIVALNNANLNGHVRGSIWVGGTLTSGEYKFVDDGSINHSSTSDSYVRNNNSSIQFKGRTNAQSASAFYYLSDNAVSNTRAYWRNLIINIGENENWIYVKPNENGYVDLQYWDYQSSNNDENIVSINRIYWTDATSVTVGGLAGHLIAPYANVTVVNCNYCGSIVAYNITTSGESHINYWTPPSPPTPEPVDVTINKTLIGSVWHVRCDYMDGITFKAGGGYWRRDWISNYEGKTSLEGHRSNKCGDADHWVIWVDADGNPFRMDEIKSGATGGTLPTIIYEPRYSFTHDEILAMESGDLDLIWKYSQNFIDTKDWSTIKIGERMYWTTSNNGQIWYHTGIPYKVESPTYTIYIDGEGYDLVSNGGTVTIEDLEIGVHTIVEEKYPDTYVSNIYVNGVVLSEYNGSIEITTDTSITVENTLITPPPTNSPTPPPTPIVLTPTPTPTSSPTPTPTPSPTPTPTPSSTPTPSPTPESTSTPTPTPTPEITVTPTTTPEVTITSTPTTTPEVTITPTPTPNITPTPTPEVIVTSTPTPEITNTPTPEVTITPSPTTEVTNTPSPIPEITITPSPTPTITPTPTSKTKVTPTPTVKITPTPTVTPKKNVTPTPTSKITVTPTATIKETYTPTPTKVPEITSTPTPSATPTPTSEITEEPTSTPEITPTPTPIPEITSTPTLIPEIPEGMKKPKIPSNIELMTIDDYKVALGIGVIINHVGDCFD